MINTNTNYINKMALDTRTTRIWLKINVTGTEELIGEDEIVGGSFSFDTSSTDNGKFALGSTYSSRCKISLYKDYNIEDLIGKNFLVTFGVLVSGSGSSASYQYVDFGLMTITEALQEKNYITITGYDSLFGSDTFPDDAPIKEDRSISLLLAYLYTYCNVTGYNSAGVNGYDVANYMPKRNSSDIVGYTYKLDTRLFNSPKEILSEIGILCGGFFARERKAYSQNSSLPNDRIVFKPYTNQNTTIDIVKNHIKRLKISSTEVKFGKVTITVDGTKYSTTWGTGTAEYETELKLLTGQTPTDIYDIVGDIANRLIYLGSFTPCEFDYFGDPNIEIGDRVKIPYKNGYIYSYVTDIVYKQRGIETIKCGGDVTLSKKSESTAEKQNRVTRQMISEKFNVTPIRNTTSTSINVRTIESSVYYTDIWESSEINITNKNTFQINGYLTVNPTVAGQTLLIRIGTRKENEFNYTFSTYRPQYNLPISGKQSVNISLNIDLEYTEGWNKIKLQALILGSSGTATIDETNLLQIGNNY